MGSRGQVIDFFSKKFVNSHMGSRGQVIDFFLQKVCEFPVLLSKCGARTIPEFQLHTKDRQKDIVRDVMRELGAGPRQMVRVCGLTYAVVYKMWKDL